MLIIENISKTFFPGSVNEKKALQGVSLTLNDGDFATVIGSNGAGKSTLLNAIAGAFQIDQGKIVIDGDDAFINVVDHPGKTRETAKLESHKKFLDVHVPLSAPETLGWTPRGEIPETPYDEAGDCQVYDGPAKVYTTIQPGEFVVYWPEDIHAPAISDKPFRKLIMKARC